MGAVDAAAGDTVAGDTAAGDTVAGVVLDLAVAGSARLPGHVDLLPRDREALQQGGREGWLRDVISDALRLSVNVSTAGEGLIAGIALTTTCLLSAGILTTTPTPITGIIPTPTAR